MPSATADVKEFPAAITTFAIALAIFVLTGS
jgi:hypothetical protein